MAESPGGPDKNFVLLGIKYEAAILGGLKVPVIRAPLTYPVLY